VERLDDRDPQAECRAEDGRRRGGEGVVDVHDLRAGVSESTVHAPFSGARPHGVQCKSKIADWADGLPQLGVVEKHLFDGDPGALQELPLGIDDSILSTGLAIPGVHLDNTSNRAMIGHDWAGRLAKRVITRPSPNTHQNQMPPCGPSR
jgi:hypothetical protein